MVPVCHMLQDDMNDTREIAMVLFMRMSLYLVSGGLNLVEDVSQRAGRCIWLV